MKRGILKNDEIWGWAVYTDEKIYCPKPDSDFQDNRVVDIVVTGKDTCEVVNMYLDSFVLLEPEE